MNQVQKVTSSLSSSVSVSHSKYSRAQKIVAYYASGSAVVGASPIPFADLPALAAIQVRMTYDLGCIYCPDFDIEDALLVTTTIGAGSFGLREIARQSIKALPGIGWLVSGSVAAAGTEAFGQLAIAYFREKYE